MSQFRTEDGDAGGMPWYSSVRVYLPAEQEMLVRLVAVREPMS